MSSNMITGLVALYLLLSWITFLLVSSPYERSEFESLFIGLLWPLCFTKFLLFVIYQSVIAFLKALATIFTDWNFK